MAILMAASIFALPTNLLAAQDQEEPAPANANASLREANARRVNALPKSTSRYFIAGPSRYAFASRQRSVTSSAQARQYTEEELREIRAAQVRLIRNMGAGPGSKPSGTAVLSHPTLGRITITTTDPITPKPGGGGTVAKPTSGHLAGPSSSAGSFSPDPKAGSGGGGGGEPGDFPVLRAGSGFGSATPQPPAVGNPSLPGYDAQAIARWDAVPYQDFDGLFHIGVVAFHMNGIDRVEFSANGGPWTPVYEMKLNPRTNVWEFTATLDAAAFEDGLVEVRARVFPKHAGETRVLGGEIDGTATDGMFSMFLHANSDQTLNREIRFVAESGSDETGDGTRTKPFRTIGHAAYDASGDDRDASGATVFLLPGDYEFGPYSYAKRFRSDSAWVTVSAAPGVSKGDVRIIGSTTTDGLRTDMVRLTNLTVEPDQQTTPLNAASRPIARLWLDDCVLRGTGRTTSVAWWNGFEQSYSTDLHVSHSRDGLSGLLVRNATIENIGSDAFSNARFVVNSVVRDIDRGGVDFHPDVFQLYGPSETFQNIIVYGLEAYNANSQGIFARGLQGVEDSAFVNVLIELTNPVMLSQWRSPHTDHVLFWHVTHLNKPMWFRLDESRGIIDTSFHNVSFVGCVFESIMDEAGLVPSSSFRHVHDIRGDSSIRGVDITTGTPGFRNPRDDDYSLLPRSPLLNRVIPTDRSYQFLDELGTPLVPGHVGAWRRPSPTSGS